MKQVKTSPTSKKVLVAFLTGNGVFYWTVFNDDAIGIYEVQN
jgi:hypothetical protein